MRRTTCTIILIAGFEVFSAAVKAGYIRGRNWADNVQYYTERIQCYGVGGCTGGVLMEPQTTWWVLGASDCDMDGDMNAFTEDSTGALTIDNDYVAGWRGGGPANQKQEIVVKFHRGLDDIPAADDLVIRLYCGGKARCSVWASADSNDLSDFVKIGEVVGRYDQIPGTPGKLYDAHFDFNGVFASAVHYIRVYREAVGSDTAVFFDSFASAKVMEPNSCQEVALFGWSMESDINADCYVDFLDYAILISEWHRCNDPNNPGCDCGAFADPNQPPSPCYGVWQSGFGMQADLNHDCYVEIMDLAEFAHDWLRCNNPYDTSCRVNW